ncbi:uncharacterized protein LOC115688027 [Syzygium oleosum]|uniref:uncharacterized protein LOC115688027 n=1 Tax=Syzygium oleosum TaxID=219896 RepID=UPI0024BBEA9B|nr:uncharacterized protein LOC115688027 [Syzygium oleosum]
MGRKTTKKSATFRLMSRDSSADDAPGDDRIFVRVDNNPCSIGTSADAGNDDGDDDPMSMIADAPGDCDDGGGGSSDDGAMSTSRLPDHIRREILELGFPDDGYNYLWHLREIRNKGGGSAFYQNPKARLDLVPKDVKHLRWWVFC